MSENAIIYARVSTRRQAEEGASLPAQVEACERYAADSGLNVVKVIQDDGYSGMKFNRPGLNEAKDMIQGGQASVLIVYSSDRLTRKLAHKVLFDELLDKADATLHYVVQLGPADDSAEAKMGQNMQAVFNEYWRDKMVESIRRGKRQKAKNGKVGQGTPKYGYRTTDKHQSGLMIYEPEARVVRRIFDLYTGRNGRPMSLKSITELMNSEGVPTMGTGTDDKGGRGKLTRRGQGGKKWYRQGIYRQIITRPEYIGEFTYLDLEFRYPELAIIDMATWQAAQEQVQKNKHKARRKEKAGPFPLSGRLTCKCGHSMVGTTITRQRGGRYRYYRCSYSAGNKHSGCDAKMLKAELIDDLAWEWLSGLFMNQEQLDRELEAMATRANEDLRPIQAELSAAQTLLEKSKGKISKWLDAFGEEDDPDIAAMAAKRVKDEKGLRNENQITYAFAITSLGTAR